MAPSLKFSRPLGFPAWKLPICRPGSPLSLRIPELANIHIQTFSCPHFTDEKTELQRGNAMTRCPLEARHWAVRINNPALVESPISPLHRYKLASFHGGETRVLHVLYTDPAFELFPIHFLRLDVRPRGSSRAQESQTFLTCDGIHPLKPRLPCKNLRIPGSLWCE